MSKTFRRPNYEVIHKHRVGGRKIAGFYTMCDISGVWLDNRHTWIHHYRLPTEREAFELFRTAHLDCHRNRGMYGVWVRGNSDAAWRKIEEHRYRQNEKRKIIRYLKGRDEDVISGRLLKDQFWTWPD